MANAENFGMMDGAYFVSRTELLDWLNSTLGLSYSKVEQCCSGLAHLQLLDCMFPGKVPLARANFDARLEHEYINNFKLLQSSFTGNGIKKVIEIEKLVKGKYQDNLEFLQWMKRYSDARMPKGPVSYDPVAVREAAISTQKRLKQSRGARSKGAASAGSRKRETSPSSTVAAATATSATPNHTQQEPGYEEMGKMEKLKMLETLEAERDFYYSKLRDIEILCMEDTTGVIQKSILQDILYAVSGNFEGPPGQYNDTKDDCHTASGSEAEGAEGAGPNGPVLAAVDEQQHAL